MVSLVENNRLCQTSRVSLSFKYCSFVVAFQNFNVAAKSDLVDVTPVEESKQYLVRFAFEAQNIGELSLRKGDHVTVLRHSDTSGNPEWWLVESHGTTGYVPGSFLTLFGTGKILLR